MATLIFLYLLLITAQFAPLQAGPLSSLEFIVDVERGSDSNSGQGTEDAFKTIGRCLEEVKAQGGDCLIREGRYREQLQLAGVRNTPRPITIKGYEEERPTWDGTHAIRPESWGHDPSTGACTTHLNKDIFALFLEDDLLTAARWPNALWSDRTVFLVDHWRPTQFGSDRGLVVDEMLAESGLDMTGAMAVLNIGSWVTYVAKVDSHEIGSDRFLYNDTFNIHKFKPEANHYYLEGSKALLDAPGEWFYHDHELFVIPPKGKTCQDLTSLRGRTVDYGLTITDSTDITIANITFFGANINAYGPRTANIDRISFDSLTFLFPSSSHRMLGDATPPMATQLIADRHKNGSISVTNCTFYGSEGSALVYESTNGIVTNNLFTYNDWAVQGDTACVESKSYDGKISHNTFDHNGSNKALRFQGRRAEIFMNHIAWTCWGDIQNDGSALHIPGSGAVSGVNIHHNWIHDSPKKGFRFDSTKDPDSLGGNGYMGYNVGWNSVGDAEFAPKGDNHTIEHNTAIDSDDDCSLCVYSKHLNVEMNKHTIVLNNAATVRADGGGVIENNFDSPDLTDYLVDADNYDFRPLADSPLVLANGDYSGAYKPQENTYWIPGFKKSQASFPIPGDGQTLRMGRTQGDALQHLCGTGDGLADPVAPASHHLLGEEDLLCWDFNTQISTGNHDAITSLQDLIKSAHTLVVLQLADDLDVLALVTQGFPDSTNIITLTDEGGEDHINTLLHAKLQV